MSRKITTGEWEAELDALGLSATEQAGEGSFTTADVAARVGITQGGARRRIKELFMRGRLELAGTVRRPSMNGQMQPVPAYRIKK